MTAILLAVAALVEVGLLAYVVLTALRDRSSLARFVRAAAADAERLKDVAMQLPGAYRAPATQFAGELARKGSLDEIIAQAVTKAANTTFGLAPLVRVATGGVLAVVIFAPLAGAMLATASSIADAQSTAKSLAGSRVFLAAKDKVDPAFADLHAAFQGTALLLAGIILVGAAHWWLNRPEVREARFIKALLEAAIGARPGASAPVSGRLTQLIAPDRSLAAPIAAFVFFFCALSAGWLLLYLTAGVKEANAADVYNVWPADTRPSLGAPSGMMLPSFNGGGAPVKERSLATLAIGPESVELAGERLVDLDQRFLLSEKFPADAIKLTLSGFKRGTGEMDINVLGHRPVPMSTVLGLFQLLRNTYNVRHANLVFARGMDVGQQEGAKIPAAVFLQVAPPEVVIKALTLAIDGGSVMIDPASNESINIERQDTRWRARLSEAVRKRTAEKNVSQPWVAVSVKSGEITYERFLDVLSAADSTCPQQAADCGVPGLGLHFYLEKP